MQATSNQNLQPVNNNLFIFKVASVTTATVSLITAVALAALFNPLFAIGVSLVGLVQLIAYNYYARNELQKSYDIASSRFTQQLEQKDADYNLRLSQIPLPNVAQLPPPPVTLPVVPDELESLKQQLLTAEGEKSKLEANLRLFKEPATLAQQLEDEKRTALENQQNTLASKYALELDALEKKHADEITALQAKQTAPAKEDPRIAILTKQLADANKAKGDLTIELTKARQPGQPDPRIAQLQQQLTQKEQELKTVSAELKTLQEQKAQPLPPPVDNNIAKFEEQLAQVKQTHQEEVEKLKTSQKAQFKEVQQKFADMIKEMTDETVRQIGQKDAEIATLTAKLKAAEENATNLSQQLPGLQEEFKRHKIELATAIEETIALQNSEAALKAELAKSTAAQENAGLPQQMEQLEKQMQAQLETAIAAQAKAEGELKAYRKLTEDSQYALIDSNMKFQELLQGTREHVLQLQAAASKEEITSPKSSKKKGKETATQATLPASLRKIYANAVQQNNLNIGEFITLQKQQLDEMTQALEQEKQVVADAKEKYKARRTEVKDLKKKLKEANTRADQAGQDKNEQLKELRKRHEEESAKLRAENASLKQQLAEKTKS